MERIFTPNVDFQVNATYLTIFWWSLWHEREIWGRVNGKACM